MRRKTVTDLHGPAVQLGNAESIFPHLLANAWRARGLESLIVSATSPRRLPPEAQATQIIDVALNRTRTGTLIHGLAKRIVQPVDRLLAGLSSSRFQQHTGFAAPQAWETQFVPHIVNGWNVARAARRLQPLFVFGHEVTGYGLATAWCGNVPKILFPWGADVMTTAEISPWHFRLARHALHAADLIVPSSSVAARYICERFGVNPVKVRAVSWGAELGHFKRLDGLERVRAFERWGIDAAHQVVLNARRFLPLYSCGTAVEAFLRVAAEKPDVHFVFLGGRDTEALTDAARRHVDSLFPVLSGRFTFLRDNISQEACASLMGIADVFVSLCDRVDMRSKSVLEAAAAGGVPVLGESEEYRTMQAQGFQAHFVEAGSADHVANAVLHLLKAPTLRLQMSQRNVRFLAEHEDSERQMDRLLETVLDGVARRRGRS